MARTGIIARWLLGAWLSLGTQCVYASDYGHVLLVLSDSSPLYQEFASTFAQNLPVGMHLKTLQRAEEFAGEASRGADGAGADLVVTVGVKAAENVAGKTTLPMLAAMIPSNTYTQLQLQRRGQTSAIYLDQPLDRQVNFLSAAMPDRHRVGVLHSAAWNMQALRAELIRQHATLTDVTLHESLFSALETVLSDSDMLLAVPDGAIYNGNNIRNILLSSYRRGIPLAGFSQALVKAGALCAIFSTPGQLAAQAGEAAAAYAKTGKLPVAQYPVLYSVAVNQEVARTLNIPIKSAEALRLQLEKSSGATR